MPMPINPTRILSPLFALISAFMLALALQASPSRAQAWLDQHFDAATLSREDTATIQAALAWTGDYLITVDGVWSDASQAAFEKYVTRSSGSARAPRYSDIAELVKFLEDERVKNNWQLNYSAIANTSYLFPFGLIDPVEGKQNEYMAKDDSISLIIREGSLSDAKTDHDWFLGKAAEGSKPYHYADDKVMVSWVTIDDSISAYVRSDLHNGLWTSMNFVTTQEGYFRVNLLAGTTTVGEGSPATLLWTEGGVIDQVINGASSTPPADLAAAAPRAVDQVNRPGKAASAPPAVSVPPVAADPPKGDLVEVNPGPGSGTGGDSTTTGPAGGILGTPAPDTAPDTATADAGSPAPAATIPDLPKAPDTGSVVASGPGGLGVEAGSPAPIRAGDGGAISGMPKVAPVAETPRPKVSGTLKGSGTGFYIAPNTLVTAAHVIEGCSAIGTADGSALEVLAADVSLDVAVLGGAPDTGAWLKLSALEVPRLGEAVTTLGYPYSTSLDQGLTVTSGNVSALRGADGSSNRVMITAPVQPGNSGGPLLNKKGSVIGVVVSRVDDIAMFEETGTLPQNMNFAVPSGPLLTFLAKERISRPQGSGVGGDISVELPDAFANAVVPVQCYR